MVEHLVTLLLPSVAFIIGGVSLAVGEGGGLYWVPAGILFAFVSASINGWVLLVEIKVGALPGEFSRWDWAQSVRGGVWEPAPS